MKIAYDLTGSPIQSVREYDIATGTAVAIDQVVKLSSNKVIPVVAGETSAILGVAIEAHGGSADAFNPRANGLRIKISDSPTAVMECPAPRATATGGSTTTFVCSSLNSFADNDFVGGVLKLVQKGASSILTDPINTEYPVTGFTNASGTFTIAAITGGFTAGDIVEIYPPVGFQKGNFDAGFTKLVLTASAALPIKVANRDTARSVVQFEAALHQHGNKMS